MSLAFFDLEGPLSPLDAAYELMKRIPGGSHTFEVISRYDDLLTIQGRQGYEPGDTLALIAPFLVRHSIAERDIQALGENAPLVAGAAETVKGLGAWGITAFCVSTSYHPFAQAVAKRVGIPAANVACTPFPLDRYRQELAAEDPSALDLLMDDVANLHPGDDDDAIQERLNRFFWQELAAGPWGKLLKEVKPLGGQRKVEAITTFARAARRTLKDAIAVGDSITDVQMLQAVNDAGGLAVAFNANEYALPHATISLASTHLSDLQEVLQMWPWHGREAAEGIVRRDERLGGKGDRGYFHWLVNRSDLSEPTQIHRRLRRLVREAAAELG